MCQMLPQPTLFMPRMPLVTQGRAKSIHLKGWSQKSHLEKKKRPMYSVCLLGLELFMHHLFQPN